MADEKKYPVLRPREGLKVIDPVTRQPLAPGGEAKRPTAYWGRRILDGDVVEVVMPPERPTLKPAEKTAEKPAEKPAVKES